MTRNNILKVTLAALGTIILGAIGSGVWAELLGPAIGVARGWVLDSISLIFIGFKNGVYAEIARDHGSALNIQTYSLLLSFFGGAVGGATGLLLGSLRSMKGHHSRMVEGLKDTVSGKDRLQEIQAQIDADQKEFGAKVRKMRNLAYAAVVGGAFFLALNLFSFSKLSYIDAALTHYHQVLRIAGPYLSPEERIAVESQFAQIQDKAGYELITGRLAEIAKTHGQSVPIFHVW